MNHAGIHVLDFALREVLGGEVDQNGTLVSPEKLRFDFSHKAGVTDEELKKIEDTSDKYIKGDKESVCVRRQPVNCVTNRRRTRCVRRGASRFC